MKEKVQKFIVKVVHEKSAEPIADDDRQLNRLYFNYAGMYLFPLFPMGDLSVVLHELRRTWKKYAEKRHSAKQKHVVFKGVKK
ncbi:hypothetical protein [Sphingobacterium prati]|uniref:hypothetical protein n=1 Tax=Sphingobacterium prati TaxID=2737006 RepID=UPI001554828A|nr:hypothetical protein [Sphingobacterium prati]NPE46838.1 hypothetical protein [Sphingobacterium prati]